MEKEIKTLTTILMYPAETYYLKYIRSVITGFAIDLGYDKGEADKLELAVDEACTNVIKYSYENGMNPKLFQRRREDEIKNPMDILIEASQNEFRVSITNRGMDFDSTTFESGSLDEKIEKKEVKGYGIIFIKTLMGQVKYLRDHQIGNILSMVYYKKLK